jgi:cell division protein FtsA
MLSKLKRPSFGRSKQSNSDKEQYILGLDIGTENIKALIGHVKGDTIEIVGVGREHQHLADMQAGAIADIASVVNNCDKAIAQAEKMAGVSVEKAVIGIAGELVKGTTLTVNFTRTDPSKPLDMPEIEHIIGLVQARALEKAKAQLAWELGGKDVEIRLVNSALVSITIDSHAVSSPLGFQGRDIVIQLYTAFSPLIHIGALERTALELELELLAVAAEPFAVARSVIGNDPNANLNAILMDVGGGTTDIAVLNEGGVEGTKIFGIGGRAFTKSIERDMATDFDQAEILKLAVDSSKIPQHKNQQVKESLQKTLDVWISGVELALGEYTKLDHLPHRLLLCGGGSSLTMLMEQLGDDSWHKSLPFTRKPVVEHIDPSQVVGIVDKTDVVTDHTYITAMGLLRVGLDTLNQQNPEHNAGSIKERINRLLSV